MTLLLAYLAHAAAAVSAVALTLRRRRHLPVAVALSAALLTSLARSWLNRTALAAPGPYVGWTRRAFHVEEALYLLGPAALAWMSVVVLMCAVPCGCGYKDRDFCPRDGVAMEQIVQAMDRGGPDAAREIANRFAKPDRCLVVAAIWVAWLAISCACAAAYPALRGDPLRLVYLGAQIAAVFVATSCAVPRVVHGATLIRERRHVKQRLARGWNDIVASIGLDIDRELDRLTSPTALVVLLVVACELADLLAGGWRYGLYGAAYEPTQAILAVMYAAVTLVQVAALWWRNGDA